MNNFLSTLWIFTGYASLSKERMSNFRETFSIFYHSLRTVKYGITINFMIFRLYMLFIKKLKQFALMLLVMVRENKTQYCLSFHGYDLRLDSTT